MIFHGLMKKKVMHVTENEVVVLLCIHLGHIHIFSFVFLGIFRHMGSLQSMKFGALVKAIHRFTMVKQNYGMYFYIFFF